MRNSLSSLPSQNDWPWSLTGQTSFRGMGKICNGYTCRSGHNFRFDAKAFGFHHSRGLGHLQGALLFEFDLF